MLSKGHMFTVRKLGSESSLSLSSCVTLNKLLHLFGPLFCRL